MTHSQIDKLVMNMHPEMAVQQAQKISQTQFTKPTTGTFGSTGTTTSFGFGQQTQQQAPVKLNQYQVIANQLSAASVTNQTLIQQSLVQIDKTSQPIVVQPHQSTLLKSSVASSQQIQPQIQVVVHECDVVKELRKQIEVCERQCGGK